jgi:hypothetical protein
MKKILFPELNIINNTEYEYGHIYLFENKSISGQ